METNGHIYRGIDSNFFDSRANILGLDYYNKQSMGEDDFSRKQVWFYVYGDDQIKKEFAIELRRLLTRRFEKDEADWDTITIMPTHVKDEVNPNMMDLAEDAVKGFDLKYNQVLRRKETVQENHELETLREKLLNLEGSLETQGDVEGKNVIVIDNISLSGASLNQAVETLKRNGAEKVACVCLGLGEGQKDSDITDLGMNETMSELEEKITVQQTKRNQTTKHND